MKTEKRVAAVEKTPAAPPALPASKPSADQPPDRSSRLGEMLKREEAAEREQRRQTELARMRDLAKYD